MPDRCARPIMQMMSKIAELMVLSVNGEPVQMTPGATLADLMAQLVLDSRKVAVERNLEIVPRAAYALTLLQAGDRLEIVHFIGGG